MPSPQWKFLHIYKKGRKCKVEAIKTKPQQIGTIKVKAMVKRSRRKWKQAAKIAEKNFEKNLPEHGLSLHPFKHALRSRIHGEKLEFHFSKRYPWLPDFPICALRRSQTPDIPYFQTNKGGMPLNWLTGNIRLQITTCRSEFRSWITKSSSPVAKLIALSYWRNHSSTDFEYSTSLVKKPLQWMDFLQDPQLTVWN